MPSVSTILAKATRGAVAGAIGTVAMRAFGDAQPAVDDEPARPPGASPVATQVLAGAGYGLLHALLNRKREPVAAGLVTGAGAFVAAWTAFGAQHLDDPVSALESERVARDLSAHLLFGLATAAAFWVFNGKDR